MSRLRVSILKTRRVALFSLVVSAAFNFACAGAPAGPPPNVILISADTLRADHVGVNGYPRATSPAIDALATQKGLSFIFNAQQGLVWADPSLDISQELIEILNSPPPAAP